MVDLALEEVLDEGGVVLAEWGEAAEPLYGADALVVRLGWGEADDERSITLRGPRGRPGRRVPDRWARRCSLRWGRRAGR